MGGYTAFLGPITGIMITDVSFRSSSSSRNFEINYAGFVAQYWLVHRTHVDVPAMYQPHGRYRYSYGVVSLPERGSCVLSLMTFEELARRGRNDSLGATHNAGTHQ